MISSVDYNSNSTVWSQNKWKGTFKVKWIYVKDVPNPHLRHIRLENNENKSVTNSRDTQEVLNSKGIQVMRIVHSFKHSTSIFDDFIHYEKRQELEDSRKTDDDQPQSSGGGGFQRGGSSDKSQYNYNDVSHIKSHHSGAGGGGGGGGYDKHGGGSGGGYGGGKNYGK